MSDLKYQSLEMLQRSKIDCERYISNLKSNLNGQEERLKWINKYIFQKTVKELSIEDIEKQLGHKVIIK